MNLKRYALEAATAAVAGIAFVYAYRHLDPWDDRPLLAPWEASDRFQFAITTAGILVSRWAFRLIPIR